MLFLALISSVGIFFLLSTLWHLFQESRASRRRVVKAEIIRFVPRNTLRLSRTGEADRRSAGKAV